MDTELVDWKSWHVAPKHCLVQKQPRDQVVTAKKAGGSSNADMHISTRPNIK